MFTDNRQGVEMAGGLPPRRRWWMTRACGWGCIESPLFIPLTPVIFGVMLLNRIEGDYPWSRQLAMGVYTPISPWALLRPFDQLPVMACLAVAVTLGFLVTFWCLASVTPESEDTESLPATAADANEIFRAPDADRRLAAVAEAISPTEVDEPPATDESNAETRPEEASSGRRGFAAVMCGILLVEVIVVAGLNLRQTDGRNGAFADKLAGEILDRLGSRDWIVSGEAALDDCGPCAAAQAVFGAAGQSDTTRRAATAAARDCR